jgi:glutathione S-transferase
MKIIESNRAPNPRRVRIFLAEKGVDIAFEQIDLAKLDHKRPEFCEFNPMKQVPVLILDDGTAIAETVAICRYFEGLKPEPRLFGDGHLEQAKIEMWNRRLEFGLFFPVAQIFRHLHPAMKALEVPQISAWADANRPRVYDMLSLVDSELAHREFMACDRFTIADITALVAIDFMKPAKLARPPELENFTRWYDAVSARPSAAA